MFLHEGIDLLKTLTTAFSRQPMRSFGGLFRNQQRVRAAHPSRSYPWATRQGCFAFPVKWHPPQSIVVRLFSSSPPLSWQLRHELTSADSGWTALKEASAFRLRSSTAYFAVEAVSQPHRSERSFEKDLYPVVLHHLVTET
jgi:hypothetical protein